MSKKILYIGNGKWCYTEDCAIHTVNVRSTHHHSENAISVKTVKPRGSAKSNTSASEALYIKAILNEVSDNTLGADENYNSILALPEEKKFKIIRGLGFSDIKKVALDLKAKLENELKVNKLNLSSSPNNRIGSDLEENNTGVSIELKFGAATDVNAGMKAFEHLIPQSGFNALATHTDKVLWKSMYKVGDNKTPSEAYISKLKKAGALINNHIGEPVSSEGQHIINSYYNGITSYDEILKLKNEPNLLKRKIIRLNIDKKGKWNRFSRPALVENKQWVLSGASVSESNRLTVNYKNEESGYNLRLIYNHKNDYKISGTDIVVPAKNGLSSPNVNGWFDKIR